MNEDVRALKDAFEHLTHERAHQDGLRDRCSQGEISSGNSHGYEVRSMGL